MFSLVKLLFCHKEKTRSLWSTLSPYSSFTIIHRNNIYVLLQYLFPVENSTYFSPAPFKALLVLLTKITPSSAAPSLLVLFCLVSICFSFGLPCPCSVPQPQTGHSLKAGFFILYLNLYAIIHYLTYSKNAQ